MKLSSRQNYKAHPSVKIASFVYLLIFCSRYCSSSLAKRGRLAVISKSRFAACEPLQRDQCNAALCISMSILACLQMISSQTSLKNSFWSVDSHFCIFHFVMSGLLQRCPGARISGALFKRILIPKLSERY